MKNRKRWTRLRKLKPSEKINKAKKHLKIKFIKTKSLSYPPSSKVDQATLKISNPKDQSIER